MMAMDKETFGVGRVLVVAELAQSYEGSFAGAEALIRAAASAKADAVKFQVFSADELAVPSYQHYELFQKLEFTAAQWDNLFGLARNLKLLVFADVLGLDGLKMLDALHIDGLKIHASDILNIPLLEAVGRTGRPAFLSCGGSTYGEISEAIRVLREAGSKSLCLLHGFQASPTAPEDSRFLCLKALRRSFEVPVGYADHIDAGHPLARQWPLIALGVGVEVIEKHLTLNRSDQKEDYISALNPYEFAQMVEWIRLGEAGLGRADFDLTPAETAYRQGFRKRVVAAHTLEAGRTLTLADVALKRVPGDFGLSDLRAAIGGTLVRAVSQHAPIDAGLLAARPTRPRLVAALACRAGSSRLYGKPVQIIGDRTILEYLIARLQSVARVDQIVLAISEGVENELFIDYARKLGLEYVIGDEIDVQERLILAGERGKADLLLRSTTESPFVYTDNIEEMVEKHIAAEAALTVTEGLPDGSYCEIITLSALKDAHERGERRHRSELCTLYMFEHQERYKTVKFLAPEKVRRAADIRLTVDYPEDLIVCRRLAEELGKDGPLFSLESIVDYLDAHPELNAVNNWIDAGIGRIWS